MPGNRHRTRLGRIVVGGGASGLGAALEAASRGYKILLVEQADFAKSTSGKSTKLVHGGVRYLAQGDLGLVREACVERGRLSENAPHLVRNQSFVIPVYSRWEALEYTLGLKLYDWIAGRRSLGASRFISKSETLRRLPTVKAERLRGGVLYHDGPFYDARLAINLAQSLFDAGGFALNYARVIGLSKAASGRIDGVEIEEPETGRTHALKQRRCSTPPASSSTRSCGWISRPPKPRSASARGRTLSWTGRSCRPKAR